MRAFLRLPAVKQERPAAPAPHEVLRFNSRRLQSVAATPARERKEILPYLIGLGPKGQSMTTEHILLPSAPRLATEFCIPRRISFSGLCPAP